MAFTDDDLKQLKEDIENCKFGGFSGCIPLNKADALLARLDAAEDALETWDKFWKDMPKGQMRKLSFFDVGLFNDGFLKIGAWRNERKNRL